MHFDVAGDGGASFIDLVAPEVHEVVLNGTALDPAEVFADSRIALDSLRGGRNELLVVADCAYTNTGEGLHRFVDPVDKQAYLYTQFEVPDARRVFASFEQPDLKATFAFTVKAPQGWTVISNSPTPEPSADGVWTFEPTPRMSSYITALIAGPYTSVHGSWEGEGRSVPLGIYCRPSLAEHLDAEAIFEVTRLGFDWFQEKFDYAYPFAKYDQLFVPEFNAGAMENAGWAVTIRDQYVFRSKVTDAAYEMRAETILHELAHMWFGDLVTMEWWNDLWLNESFATYTSIACQAHAEGSRWPHSWTTFANTMKTWAYRQDQLPSTHPIMAEINDLEDVLVNFDGITYAKGASVLKQLVAYVGMDEFFSRRAGVLQAARVGEHPAGRPAGRAGGDLRPRPEGLVQGVAGDRGHQRAAAGDHGGRPGRGDVLRGPPGGSRRCPRAPRASPCCGRTGSRSGSTTCGTARWCAPSGSSWTWTAS